MSSSSHQSHKIKGKKGKEGASTFSWIGVLTTSVAVAAMAAYFLASSSHTSSSSPIRYLGTDSTSSGIQILSIPSPSSLSLSSTTLQAAVLPLYCRSDYATVKGCWPPTRHPWQQVEKETSQRQSLDEKQKCARLVVDDFLTDEEVDNLKQMAEIGISLGGGGAGGVSIYDAFSGASSRGEQFINVYKKLQQEYSTQPANMPLKLKHVQTYLNATSRVKEIIKARFGISDLYLSSPSFFSKITGKPAKTKHDEYWHSHVDKVQYGSFIYTGLLYLNDYNIDFTGGEFIFEEDKTQETQFDETHLLPQRRKLSVFTSGHENVHRVAKVTSGTRYALTIAFTCDQKKSIEGKVLKDIQKLLTQ